MNWALTSLLRGNIFQPSHVQVERIGPQHQAGSDSLLTGRAFFKMQEIYFEDELDDSKV